jgi:Domain of unknown function (DUF4157)
MFTAERAPVSSEGRGGKQTVPAQVPRRPVTVPPLSPVNILRAVESRALDADAWRRSEPSGTSLARRAFEHLVSPSPGSLVIPRKAAGDVVQAKAAISQPGDASELEADRVADQVLRMPDLGPGAPDIAASAHGVVQRMCSKCEEQEHGHAVAGPLVDEDYPPLMPPSEVAAEVEEQPEKKKREEAQSPAVRAAGATIHRKQAGTADAPPGGSSVELVGTGSSRGGGQALDAATRAFFEPRFGRSFEQVRVHTGARAAASTRAISALAYTTGSDVVFSPGQYAPHSPAGRRLLAHELAHVVQQDPSLARASSPSAPVMAGRAEPAATIQRWSADGPAPGTTNTIVCDGSGGIRVQIGTANDATGLACMRDCLEAHEASHGADALAANAKVCDGAANGSQVVFGAGEQKPSEIKASQAEIDCLNAKLPTANATCKPRIQQRITQMIAYRDSFK